MGTDSFVHIAEVSTTYGVSHLETMDVLDGFVQEMTSTMEIVYQGESYDLNSLGDVMSHGSVDDVGDAIASQLFDDLTTTKFVALTLHGIPDGEVFLPSRVVSAMCDAVTGVGVCGDEDVVEKAAKDAFEETRWSAVAMINDELDVWVDFGTSDI